MPQIKPWDKTPGKELPKFRNLSSKTAIKGYPPSIIIKRNQWGKTETRLAPFANTRKIGK
jgi:hypothetical protein